MRKVFISPHNDDETLFGAFTIMANLATIEVVIVYDSFVQVERGWSRSTAQNRRNESLMALKIMGIPKDRILFLGMDDRLVELPKLREQMKKFSGCQVYYPAFEPTGNRHHNAVAQAVELEVHSNMQGYLTYSGTGKSDWGRKVIPATWRHVQKKLAALSCYETQLEVSDCLPHFLRSQEEYWVA